jgi:hypothetical protein
MSQTIVFDDKKLMSWINSDNQGTLTAKQVITNLSDYLKSIGVAEQYKIKSSLELLQQQEPVLYLSNKRYRDHVMHACRVAIMGDMLLEGKIVSNQRSVSLLRLCMKLMERNGCYAELFKHARQEGLEGDALEKMLRESWYIGALLHDIGYVFQAYLQMRDNVETFKTLPIVSDYFEETRVALSQMKQNLKTPALLGAKAVGESVELDHIHPVISSAYISELLESGETDSRLEIASLIAYLHDAPGVDVNFTDHPLAAIIRIADELQEWGRPMTSRDEILDYLGRVDGSPSSDRLPPESPILSIGSANVNSCEWSVQEGPSGHVVPIDLTLDYDNQSEALERTGFNFPLAIFLKRRAFKRLQIGDAKLLGDVLQEEIGTKPSLSISARVVANRYLSYEWERQVRILRWMSRDSPDCFDWVTNLMLDVKPGGTRVQIPVLPGYHNVHLDMVKDFMKNSYLYYVQDMKLKTSEVGVTYVYRRDRRGKKDGMLEVETTLKRKIVNQNQAEISEYYATIGDIEPPNTPSFKFVRVGKQRISNPPKEVASIDRHLLPGGKPGDALALVFHFGREGLLGHKLAAGDEIELEYGLDFPVPEKTSLTPDYFYNMRKVPISKLTMHVEYEEGLFKDHYIGGVSQVLPMGSWSIDSFEVVNIIRNIQRGAKTHDYVPMEAAKAETGYFVFERTFTEVPQGRGAGWIWVPRSSS